MKHKNFSFGSIKYYISEAFVSLARNSLMSLSSIATVASCIFIVVFSYCVATNLDYILEQLEDSVELSVFIDSSLDVQQVEDIYNKISSIEHVTKVEYISPDEALKSFAQRLGDSTGILEGFEADNPLRPSFTISLDDPKNQDGVINELDSEQMRALGVANVLHARDELNMLMSINNVVRIVSIIIILILGILAVVIITNTIRLTVNSRRNEITIMKYVGATDWFIKWPFVIEGILIGLIGAALPVFIFWASYGKIIDTLYNSYEFFRTLDFKFRTGLEIFPALVPIGIVLGSLIGTIGSITSMRKHLDV